MATNMTRTRENLRCVKSPAADDSRWAAVIARDRAIDGKFYYSVATTGVYCRPSCPARLAKRGDIIRAVAKRGTAVFNDAVSMHMTAEVFTTSEDELVHMAMEKMTNGWFRHLPVISHERLIGLVSIGDLVKHRLAEYEYEQKVTREYIATA